METFEQPIDLGEREASSIVPMVIVTVVEGTVPKTKSEGRERVDNDINVCVHYVMKSKA